MEEGSWPHSGNLLQRGVRVSGVCDDGGELNVPSLRMGMPGWMTEI